VSGPAVHVPHERPERNVVMRYFMSSYAYSAPAGSRTSDDARDGQDDEERNVIPPSPTYSRRSLRGGDADGVQMEERHCRGSARALFRCVSCRRDGSGLVHVRPPQLLAQRFENAEHRTPSVSERTVFHDPPGVNKLQERSGFDHSPFHRGTSPPIHDDISIIREGDFQAFQRRGVGLRNSRPSLW